VTLTIDRAKFDRVILGTETLTVQIENGHARVEGDAQALHDLIELLDSFEFWFNIVTP
jgi:alkyl sulfatase BDS1-like metallo-beta-lactamase superfamily hydrolase